MLGTSKKRRLSKESAASQSRKRVSRSYGEDSSSDGEIIPPQYRDTTQIYHVVPRLPPKNPQVGTPAKPVTASASTPAKPPAVKKNPTPISLKQTARPVQKTQTPSNASIFKPRTTPVQKKAPVQQPEISQTTLQSFQAALSTSRPLSNSTKTPESTSTNTNPYLARFENQPKRELNGLDFEEWVLEYYKHVPVEALVGGDDDTETADKAIVAVRSEPAIAPPKSISHNRYGVHPLMRLAGPIDRSFITYASPHREFTEGSSDFVCGDFHPSSTHFAMGTSSLTDMYNRPNNLLLVNLRKDELRSLEGHKIPLRPQGNTPINPLVQGQYQHSTVSDVRFVRDGQFLCSGGYDKTFKIWDVETGECIKSVSTKTNVLVMSKAGPRSSIVAAALQEPEVGIPGKIMVFDIDSEGMPKHKTDLIPQQDNFQPMCLSFDPSGQARSVIAGYCGSNSHKRWGGIVLYDVETSARKNAFLWSSSCHSDVFWHPSDMIIAASTPRKQLRPPIRSTVRVLKEGNKKPLMEFGSPQYDINTVSMSPCGNYITASGTDNVTMVWDIRGNIYRPIHQLEHGRSIHSTQPLRSTLVFNERRDEGVCGVIWLNNRTLLSGGTDGVVKAWDLGLGDPFLRDIVTMQSCVTTFKMSPDQAVLAVGDGTGHIKTVTKNQALTGELPKFNFVRNGPEE